MKIVPRKMRSEYVKNIDSNVVRCCSGNASMMQTDEVTGNRGQEPVENAQGESNREVGSVSIRIRLVRAVSE
jgi:hypothetical protein